MMEALRHPIVLLAVAYLAVTAIFQFRPLSTRLMGLDRLGILPRWKFFIPQERRLDIRMEMLGHVAGGPATTVSVNLFPARRGYHLLWYPDQHRGQVLWISTQRLALKAIRDSARIGPDSVAYQTVIRHLRHIADTYDFDQFRFVLIDGEASGTGNERTLFTSPLLTR